jgi:hypothetical protein
LTFSRKFLDFDRETSKILDIKKVLAEQFMKKVAEGD